MAELFGQPEPIRPAFRDRDARCHLLDEQGPEGILLFPTLGVGVEQPLRHDAAVTRLSAFNHWLDEDWGFHHRDRLFAVPMLSLMDVDAAAWEGRRSMEAFRGYAFGSVTQADRAIYDAFKRHLFVAPYYEDDIRGLADSIGVDNVLFGSDFPHAEGRADPVSFRNDLKGFDEDETRRIMRENALGLLRPARGL